MHPIRAILHLTQFIYTDIVCGVTNIRCGINKLVVENMFATDLLTKLSSVSVETKEMAQCLQNTTLISDIL